MGSRLSLPHLKRRPARPIGRVGGLVVALVLGLSAATASAAPPPMPKNAKARKHFDAAVERYKQQDFEGAVEEATAGLALEEHESLLFILAQAERQRGNCVEAVEVFTKFIEATENEDMRQNALTAKALCAEELAEIARQAELEAEREAKAEAEPERQPEPELPPPPPPKPWHRDALGGTLVGVGAVGVLAGGGMLIAAAVLDPSKAPDYGVFDRRRRLRPTLVLAGGITAGAGALLAAGGAVRWVLLAKRNQDRGKAAARIQMGPWLDRRRAGVVIRGRF